MLFEANGMHNSMHPQANGMFLEEDSAYHQSDSMPLQGRETAGSRIITYGEAITEAIDQAMQIDQRVIILGQGVDTPGFVYGTTMGLSQRYGKERVIETPIAEAAMTGVTLGAALGGLRPVLIHMRNDFLLVSMDQIVNHIAQWSRLFGDSVPLVIRAIVARGWGSGAQHAQSLQALFAGLDGLDVIMPATPYDVKGLFLGAVASSRPTLLLEHRWLYQEKGFVPEEPYLISSGEAVLRSKGKDLTIVALSLANRDVALALRDLGSMRGLRDLRGICALHSLQELHNLHNLHDLGGPRDLRELDDLPDLRDLHDLRDLGGLPNLRDLSDLPDLRELANEAISAEWIDLRSINPMDLDTIVRSVTKTGRLLIVEDGPMRCGVGAEIAARVSERCWSALRSPVRRVGWPGSTVPAGRKLEERFYPGSVEVKQAIRELVGENLCLTR